MKTTTQPNDQHFTLADDSQIEFTTLTMKAEIAPTQRTNDFLRKKMSGYVKQPIAFKYSIQGPLAYWSAVYSDGKVIQGYEFGIFRGNNKAVEDFYKTFSRIS